MELTLCCRARFPPPPRSSKRKLKPRHQNQPQSWGYRKEGAAQHGGGLGCWGAASWLLCWSRESKGQRREAECVCQTGRRTVGRTVTATLRKVGAMDALGRAEQALDTTAFSCPMSLPLPLPGCRHGRADHLGTAHSHTVQGELRPAPPGEPLGLGSNPLPVTCVPQDPRRGFGIAVSGGHDQASGSVVVSDVVAGGPAEGRLR